MHFCGAETEWRLVAYMQCTCLLLRIDIMTQMHGRRAAQPPRHHTARSRLSAQSYYKAKVDSAISYGVKLSAKGPLHAVHQPCKIKENCCVCVLLTANVDSQYFEKKQKSFLFQQRTTTDMSTISSQIYKNWYEAKYTNIQVRELKLMLIFSHIAACVRRLM